MEDERVTHEPGWKDASEDAEEHVAGVKNEDVPEK